MPTEPADPQLWPHSSRLPLGGGWKGHCTAPGHEGELPSDAELRDACNLGYARCERLPQARPCDAVRFALARNGESRLAVQYVCEIGHAPGEHGVLQFDRVSASWVQSHPDARIQKMAECYLDACLRSQQGQL